MALARVPVSDNKLLAALPAQVRQALEPFLQNVPLEAGQIILEEGKISNVFFPISGVISKVVQLGDEGMIEAGMIGNEGMVPLCLFMELDRTPFHAVVQNSGSAWMIAAADFKTLVKPGTHLHVALLRFAAAFMAQVSQTAACNQLHPFEKRYCRWLLMTQDRLMTNELFLKQEFAAQMLGVRRMSITPVAKRLQQSKLIQYSRGRITILDRSGLQLIACECYQRVKAVYDNLLDNGSSALS